MSDDGTGLRERLYAESENYGLHEDVRRLLREAHDELEAALSAVAPPPVDEVAALATFADYFRTNYPGPNTIICKPDWHAPKIFRAALHAILAASPAALAQQAVTDERLMFEHIYLQKAGRYAGRNEVGDYVLPAIQDAWCGWKERAALTSTAAKAAEGVE